MLPRIIDPEILLTLSAIHGVGSSKLRALLAHFGSTHDIFQATASELTAVSGIDTVTAGRIKASSDGGYAREQLSMLEGCDARLVTFWDNDYPKQLKNIFDPPAFIFVRGTLLEGDKNSIGIVGTRRPSSYGRLVTEKLTSELARKHLTIVSGLAYGIDTLAHREALHSGSRTIAVLGSGVDVIYPRENRSLAEQIISNGALISEFPMGSEPDRNNFPRRNRIICGMSLGTLVVEAGERSGALITAAMALEQNREVFAVPGNIDSANSLGTNELIKQGAKMVTSAADIFEELAPHLGQLLESDTRRFDESVLNDEERKLFSLLTNEPKHVDALAASLGKSTAHVLSVLLSLELKSFIKQLAGKYFIRG